MSATIEFQNIQLSSEALRLILIFIIFVIIGYLVVDISIAIYKDSKEEPDD